MAQFLRILGQVDRVDFSVDFRFDYMTGFLSPLIGLTDLFWDDFDPLGRLNLFVIDRASWRIFQSFFDHH